MAESRWHRLSDACAALYSTKIVVVGADRPQARAALPGFYTCRIERGIKLARLEIRLGLPDVVPGVLLVSRYADRTTPVGKGWTISDHLAAGFDAAYLANSNQTGGRRRARLMEL
jgi:hypothetical protein